MIYGVWTRKYRGFDWTEVVLEIGQGGGKNTVMEISVIYVLLWLVACENPYKVLGYFAKKSIAESQNIDITNNSAVSEGQAKTVFFDNIKQKIKAARNPKTGKNLFEEYISFNLQEEGKGDIKAKVIEFPNFFEGSGHIRLFS